MSEHTDRAQVILKANGVVFAGVNLVGGSKRRVSISTLLKMEREGSVVLRLGPDGGVMAVSAAKAEGK